MTQLELSTILIEFGQFVLIVKGLKLIWESDWMFPISVALIVIGGLLL